MARSMFDALLKKPERMGARTQSRNILGINHPLAESSPVARIPISMMPFIGGPVSGYTQEDLATLKLPEETTLFSPLGYDITDKDLAKFGLATDAMDWIPGAAIVGGMATGAGLLGRALKGKNYAPTSTEDIASALLGQSLQRQGALDNAMVAYQGSPHKFDALDPTKIGTGEGAQVYGHGMYVAENRGVAKGYQEGLSSMAGFKINNKTMSIKTESVPHTPGLRRMIPEFRAMSFVEQHGVFEGKAQALSQIRRPEDKKYLNDVLAEIDKLKGVEVEKVQGYLYEIDVPDEDIAKMLDWDAPLKLQHGLSGEQKLAVLEAGGLTEKSMLYDTLSGAEAYERIGDKALSYDSNPLNEMFKKQGGGSRQQVASEYLNELGIPGIKYYDQGSRAAGDGTRNMVLFDDLASRARILKRNDETIAEPSVDEFIGGLLSDELPLDEASRMHEGGIPYENKLITQHNLTPESLLHADKMGGLPMPSIAISKAGNPLTGYGDVTLLGSSTLATPGRKNPVYSADAYSPRYPDIHYTLKDADALKVRVQDSMDAVGDKYFKALDEFDTSGPVAFENDNAMMHAFLKESGATPNMPASADRRDIAKALRNQIDDTGKRQDFTQWTVDAAETGGVTERIFRGYTNLGNRRYAPHTLDNVIREMRKSDGESAGMFGAGSFRSKVAPKFKNFKQVQKDRSRIVGADEATKFKDYANETLSDISGDIAKYSKYKSDNPFMAQDAAMENMLEVMQGKARWEEWFDGVPADLKMKAYDFVDELKDMPTEYFEAKPQRAVSLEEFQGAIIPEDASPEVLNVLKRRGINRIQKYKTPEQRKEAFKAFEDLMYSAGGAGVLSGLYEPDALKDDEKMRRALLRN